VYRVHPALGARHQISGSSTNRAAPAHATGFQLFEQGKIFSKNGS
jgi:hypothetical protein